MILQFTLSTYLQQVKNINSTFLSQPFSDTLYNHIKQCDQVNVRLIEIKSWAYILFFNINLLALNNINKDGGFTQHNER